MHISLCSFLTDFIATSYVKSIFVKTSYLFPFPPAFFEITRLCDGQVPQIVHISTFVTDKRNYAKASGELLSSSFMTSKKKKKKKKLHYNCFRVEELL